MEETAAINAMLARLSAVRVDTDPWPHAFVADFLPDPLLCGLVAALPATPRTGGPARAWASPPTPYVASGVGLATYRSADDRLVTNIPDPGWWGEDLTDILATLAVTFHNRDVLAALMRIFQAAQRAEIERALKPEVQIQSAVRLMHDAEDYDLLVHTDSPDKLLSVVVYVPRDAGMEGGTSRSGGGVRLQVLSDPLSRAGAAQAPLHLERGFRVPAPRRELPRQAADGRRHSRRPHDAAGQLLSDATGRWANGSHLPEKYARPR